MMRAMTMAPGWYPDPFSSAAYLRWWDGTAWSSQTRLAQGPAPSPAAPAQLGAPRPAPYQGPYAPPYPAPYAQRPAAPFPLAAWGLRLVAWLVDGFIIGLVITPLYVVTLWPAFVDLFNAFPAVPADGSQVSPPDMAAFQNAMISFQERVIGVSLGLSLVAAAVSFLYMVPQNVRYGRTLGKRVVGIRIRMLAEDRNPGWKAATIRWGVYTVGAMVLSGLFTLIDCLWPLWDKPWQQALHDKAAGTVVVPVSRPQPPGH